MIPEDTLPELVADLADEQRSLDTVIADAESSSWSTPTPSPGWNIADQISHLTYFDSAAVTAIAEPDRFRAAALELLDAPDPDALTLDRTSTPAEQLSAWREARSNLLARLAGPLVERIPWYGPAMSPRSFVAARIMEYWAHGQDIVDTLHAHRTPTDRLRHVVRIGVATYGWSFVNRGQQQPTAPVGVTLQSPSGATWTYNTGAEQQINGTALDFCLVVTQRRHHLDTNLEIHGADALLWMTHAQAFAGPPTDGPAPRGTGAHAGNA